MVSKRRVYSEESQSLGRKLLIEVIAKERMIWSGAEAGGHICTAGGLTRQQGGF
jgi:hypothetical protein